MKDNYYIGYVYDNDGYYRNKYYFKEDMDTLARFIVDNPINDKTITDGLDLLVCSTFGTFLNEVADQSMVGTLQEVLIPYQTGEKKFVPITFIETEPGIMVQEELI